MHVAKENNYDWGNAKVNTDWFTQKRMDELTDDDIMSLIRSSDENFFRIFNGELLQNGGLSEKAQTLLNGKESKSYQESKFDQISEQLMQSRIALESGEIVSFTKDQAESLTDALFAGFGRQIDSEYAAADFSEYINSILNVDEYGRVNPNALMNIARQNNIMPTAKDI